MYENETEQNIRKRMLDAVPSDISNSEGSFVYDAVAPVSIELAEMYSVIDTFLDKVFAQTSHGEYLERRAAEFGIYRKEGTKASGELMFYGSEGQYPAQILIQTNTGVQFKTTIPLVITAGKGTVIVEAVEIGNKYNAAAGTINEIPIKIVGIAAVTNLQDIGGGSNRESDEELLQRLLLRVQSPATSGNAYHYRLWALEVEGIGDAKVFPTWNGPGTVKVVVVDNDKKIASTKAIEKVKEHIEEERPLGATVTIETAIAKEIMIEAKVTLMDGYTLNDIENSYAEKLEEYRKEISFNQNYISYAQIGSLLLAVPGVKDYTELKVNSSTGNISLADIEIPVIKGVNLIA